MFMKNLKALHESMLSHRDFHGNHIELQRFRSTQGGVTFECIFSTGETPYKLSLTSRGTQAHPTSEFFLFDVSAGYEITAYFGEMYGRLAETLRTKGGASGNKLMPQEFLAQLDANTPTTAADTAIPGPREVLDARPDITDERDKPYWSHWSAPRCKADGSPGGVSDKNRSKTAALLGAAALAYSDKMHMSSCWSAEPTKADWRPSA